MTGPNDDGTNAEDTGQISVAELLARNGQKSTASPGGRRRRGTTGSISVTELTGEIPAIRDDEPVPTTRAGRRRAEEAADGTAEQDAAESAASEKAAAEIAAADKAAADEAAAARAASDKAASDKAAAESAKKSDTPPPFPVTRVPGATIAGSSIGPSTSTAPKIQPSEYRPATAFFGARDAKRDEGLSSSSSLRIFDSPSSTPVAPVEASAPKSVVAPVEKPAERPPFEKVEPEKSGPTAWSNTDREPELLSGNTLAGDLMRAREDERRDAESDEISKAFPTTSGDYRENDSQGWLSEDEDSEQIAAENSHHRKQWLVLAGQAVVAVIAGALLFKGFERLWDMLPWVALVLAVLVILGLVATVRILRKTDDMFSIVIAIVVGVFVTMGPLVFLLSTN